MVLLLHSKKVLGSSPSQVSVNLCDVCTTRPQMNDFCCFLVLFCFVNNVHVERIRLQLCSGVVWPSLLQRFDSAEACDVYI